MQARRLENEKSRAPTLENLSKDELTQKIKVRL